MIISRNTCARYYLGIYKTEPVELEVNHFSICWSSLKMRTMLALRLFSAVVLSSGSSPPPCCPVKAVNGKTHQDFAENKLKRLHICKHGEHAYDAVSDLMHNWVAQRPDFKSALRVVEIVLNTQCYQYLCPTMWFHAKNQKKLKKTKIANFTM